MAVVLIALFLVWQGSALLEYEEKDGVFVTVPTTIGLSNHTQIQAFTPIAGVRSLAQIRNQGVVRQRYDYSCGSAALTTLLNSYLGMELDEQRVMSGLLTYGQREKIIARRGFSLADMKNLLAAMGYESAGFRGEMSDLRDLKQPAIIRITYGDFRHFAVLKGMTEDGRVYIADPAFGNLSLTSESFSRLWDNIVFLVYASPGQELNALEITEDDLAFIDEDQANQMLNRIIPEYYHDQHRLLDIGSGSVQYYRP